MAAEGPQLVSAQGWLTMKEVEFMNWWLSLEKAGYGVGEKELHHG